MSLGIWLAFYVGLSFLIGRLYGEAPMNDVAWAMEYDRALSANRAGLGYVGS